MTSDLHTLRFLIPLFTVLTLLQSCRDDVAWSSSHRLPSGGWDDASPVEFVIDPVAYVPEPENPYKEMTARAVGDTTRRYLGKYKALISLRYLPECNIDTISLVVSREALDAPLTADTLSVPLFDSAGQPVGKGHLGIFEASVAIPSPVVVSEGSLITISPIKYTDSIAGLTDVSIFLLR